MSNADQAWFEDVLDSLRERRDLLDRAIAAMEPLIGTLPAPVHASASGPASARAPVCALPPDQDKTKKPPRGRRPNPGSVLAFVRAVSVKRKDPFSVSQMKELVGDRRGKSVTTWAIRNAINLLVNIGELKIVHEGKNSKDPTTWQTTGAKMKAEAEPDDQL